MNAEDAERLVLSTLLLSDAALYSIRITEGLEPEHFQAHRFGTIYRAMVVLDEETGGYDRVSVAARAAALGLRNAADVMDEVSAVPARVADALRSARIVRQAALERSLRNVAAEMASGEGDPDEARAKAVAALDALGSTDKGRARRADDVAREVIEEAMKPRVKGKRAGVPSGFDDLDDLTDGFGPGLWLAAARPGMGKSAFALQIAKHAASVGVPTYVNSLEMVNEELGQRLVAQAGAVPAALLRGGSPAAWAQRKMLAAGQALDGLPLWLDDATDLSIMDIRARVRRMHQRHNLGLVIVDYIGLIRMSGDNRNNAVGEVSRGLKVLSKDLKVPVIVLSQLNREVEKRGATVESKKPQVSDLRDSGNLEQDANGVILLFREQAYDPESPVDGCEVIVAKHRNGEKTKPGQIMLPWDGPTMRFVGPTVR